MTAHLPVLPVALPLLAGILLMLPPCAGRPGLTRWVSVGFGALVLSASWILVTGCADGTVEVYAMGGWAAPWGIVLVADRLSALMTFLNAFLVTGVLVYASAGHDTHAPFFHSLVHFLAAGVSGAFLAGDLFNLFVCFEVLLISSYVLLLHGGGVETTRTAFHYVVLNLVGSSIFLIALGILYGTLGTLNMADMAAKVSALAGGRLYLVRIGALLLMVVFALKAALLPLHLWLPRTYSLALPVVGALFCIMTKVGIYAMIRMVTLVFHESDGILTRDMLEGLWGLSLLTLTVGGAGVLGSKTLERITAHLVVMSVGTLAAVISIRTAGTTASALFYMVHSTPACAALFLVAGWIKEKAETGETVLKQGVGFRAAGLAGLFAALTVVGMPPLSGFVAKFWLLQETWVHGRAMLFWPLVLLGGLAALVAVAGKAVCVYRGVKAEGSEGSVASGRRLETAAILFLLIPAVVMVIRGDLVCAYTAAAADQCFDAAGYITRVLAGR